MTVSDREMREVTRSLYRTYNDVLADTEWGRFLRFMNYGYEPVAGLEDHALLPVPARMHNREAARLVAETIADEPLDGRLVVDVGCGRGGTLGLIARQRRPRVLAGLDLTYSSAALAATTTAAHGVNADAEALPLHTGSIDVVLNIESSFHYPRLDRFLHEVHRGLAVGGALLHADILPVDSLAAFDAVAETLGLDLEIDRDVTPNVIAAHERRMDLREQAIERVGSGEQLAAFTGADGDSLHQGLRRGVYRYRITRWRRTDRPGRPVPPAAIAALRGAATRAFAIVATFDAASSPS